MSEAEKSIMEHLKLQRTQKLEEDLIVNPHKYRVLLGIVPPEDFILAIFSDLFKIVSDLINLESKPLL